jgi:hypothetical protein
MDLVAGSKFLSVNFIQSPFSAEQLIPGAIIHLL